MLPGERELFASDTGELVLTTHRLRMKSQQAGAASFVSIMLDQVASSSVAYRSYPLLMVLAAVAGMVAILGLISDSRDSMQFVVLGLVGSFGFALGYLVTRRMTLSFASAGEALHVNAKNMPMGTAVEFIEAVEAARADYVKEIHRGA